MTTPVTPVGDRRYRMEETEWMVELSHHDVIEADYLGASRLHFRGVVTRSELLPYSGIHPKELLDSDEALAVLSWLTKLGGYWQRDFGGCLVLSIPKTLESDFKARWDGVADLYRQGLTHQNDRLARIASIPTASLEEDGKPDPIEH